jgi:hypothetical protein
VLPLGFGMLRMPRNDGRGRYGSARQRPGIHAL